MNVYDTVNKLAQEIKDSEEFKNYKKYKEIIKSNQEVSENIKKFETLRYEIQISAMQGLETNKDKEKELQDIYAELLTKENVKEYFESEFKFNILLADVNKNGVGDEIVNLIVSVPKNKNEALETVLKNYDDEILRTF